jgi:hypothetical protein
LKPVIKEEIKMAKERIGLKDTTMDTVLKMSEGNPGALRVVMDMMKDGGAIDPDSWAGGLGAVLGLDSHGIYGSRIWMLYKDVCKEDLVSMLAVLRACQLGHISEATLHQAIDNYGQGIDLDEVVAGVKEALPRFGG